MEQGLQTSAGEPTGAWVYPALRFMGVENVRIGANRDPSVLRACLAEAEPQFACPMTIVQVPGLIEDLPSGRRQVELNNEPDLGTSSPFVDPKTGRRTPVPVTVYREWIREAVRLCDERRARGDETQLWVGAVSNFSEPAFAYLRAIMPVVPVDVGVSIHRYADPGTAHERPRAPRPGFASRRQEVDAFKAIIGGRRWAVTEFGWSTAPQTYRTFWWFRRRFRWTPEQVRDAIRQELDFWEEAGAVAAYLYQLASGPDPTKVEDCYGILTDDRTTWLPQAEAFRRTSPQRATRRMT